MEEDDCKSCCSSEKQTNNCPVYVLFHAKGEQRIENYHIDPIRIFLNFKDAQKVYLRMVQEHKRKIKQEPSPDSCSSQEIEKEKKKKNIFPTRIYLAQWGNMNGKLRNGNGFIQEKTLYEWKEDALSK